MPYDIYSALIGEPPTEEEKLRALASQLRMRNNQGMVGQLTGDRVLAPFGQNLSKTANTQAEDLGQRGEQARYRKYQEGASTRSDERAVAEQAWREKNAIVEQNLERAKMAQARDLAGQGNALRLAIAKEAAAAKAAGKAQGLKIGSKADQDARVMTHMGGQLTEAEKSMPSGSVEPVKDLFKKAAGMVGLAQLAGELSYDKQQKDWRSTNARTISRIVQQVSGMALTGFEIDKMEDWSPLAAGISEQSSRDRLKALSEALASEAAARRSTASYYERNSGDPAEAEGDFSNMTDEELQVIATGGG